MTWSELQYPTSQIWFNTIVDYVSNEIEVWGHKLWQTQKKTGNKKRNDGDIEALADAMRALNKCNGML